MLTRTTYHRVYEALQRLGFNADMAFQVLQDAARGKPGGMMFVRIAMRNRRLASNVR